MFSVYPTFAPDVYALGRSHPRRELDAYNLPPNQYFPSGAARLYHQPTGPFAARERYLSALEQAREAEREYLESIRGSSSSLSPYERPYDTRPYSPSYYDHDAIERERALAAALEEQRLLLLARQQEEERLRALEERRRAAAVAEELRRAREAEERRQLEEIRARNEQLKKEALERQRQLQLREQSCACDSTAQCAAMPGCQMPASTKVLPAADALRLLLGLPVSVKVEQPEAHEQNVAPQPQPKSTPAPVMPPKEEAKPEPTPTPKSQPQIEAKSQLSPAQQALLGLLGLRDEHELQQTFENMAGLFNPTVARSAPSPSPSSTPTPSKPASEAKPESKVQPSFQEVLRQRLGAEQDTDFKHVIENVLGLFNPNLARPSTPTPPSAPSASQPVPTSRTSSSPSPSEKPKPRDAAPSTTAEPKEESGSKDVLSAIHTIDNIASSFNTLEHDFEFPTQLDFTDTSAQSVLQQLTFTSRNAPLRVYEQSLTSLLAKLDAVESYGNEEVRHRRKEVVEKIEKALEEVEREVEQRAREWRAKRSVPQPEVTTTEESASGQPIVPKEEESPSRPEPSSAPQDLPSVSVSELNADLSKSSDASNVTTTADNVQETSTPQHDQPPTSTLEGSPLAPSPEQEQQPSLSESDFPPLSPSRPVSALSKADEPVEESQAQVEMTSGSEPTTATTSSTSPKPTYAQIAAAHISENHDTAATSALDETSSSSISEKPAQTPSQDNNSPAAPSRVDEDSAVVSDSEDGHDLALSTPPTSVSSSSTPRPLSKKRTPSVTVEEIPDGDWFAVNA